MIRRFAISVLLTLSGCGGFRGGRESIPHGKGGTFQEPIRDRLSAHAHEVPLPEMTVALAMNNRLKTHPYEAMLFLIPTDLNVWKEFQRQEASTGLVRRI